jgi:membrane-associated protein
MLIAGWTHGGPVSVAPVMTDLLSLDWMNPEWLLEQFGQQMFWVSLAIIFIECGLLFPILPGDSLLFSVGLFIHRAGAGEAGIDVNIAVACVLLAVAALAGNITGYEIGRRIGPAIYEHPGRFLKPEHFAKTERFFDKHGARALVLGRFVPIVRTFITLVAGVGKMDRRHFFVWSAVGAILWATGITLLGYFLGGITFLQENIEAAILVIVAVSVVPMLFEWWRHRNQNAD